jgi:hypothetical protein
VQALYEASVGEDSPPGSTVLSGITVTDLDQVGDALQLRCLPKVTSCPILESPLFRFSDVSSLSRHSHASLMSNPQVATLALH